MKTTCPYLQATVLLFMLTPAESTAKAQRLGRARTPLWFESTKKVRKDGKIGHRYRLWQDHETPSYVLGLLFHRCQEPTKAVFVAWAAEWGKGAWISKYYCGEKVGIEEAVLERKVKACHLRSHFPRWWELNPKTPQRGWRGGSVILQRSFRKNV